MVVFACSAASFALGMCSALLGNALRMRSVSAKGPLADIRAAPGKPEKIVIYLSVGSVVASGALFIWRVMESSSDGLEGRAIAVAGALIVGAFGVFAHRWYKKQQSLGAHPDWVMIALTQSVCELR